MPQNRIITLAAAALIVLDMIWFLIRGLKNGFLDKEHRSKKMVFMCVFGYIFAVLVVALSWFREFGLFGDIIFAGCGVLAVEIENRQLLGIVKEYD